MKSFTVYLTRTDTDERFLICSKEQQFETNDKEEANTCFDRQASFLRSLPQSEIYEGIITLHMDLTTRYDGIGLFESNKKSVSVPLILHSKLALEKSQI